MIDLAVVGAGAAGISAAREASRRGLDCVVLEASDRVGGRAHSIDWRGHSLDLGAGWLHSGNRNPLVPLAEQLGRAIDRSPTPWREQFRGLGFSREEQMEAFGAFASFDEAVSQPQPGDNAAKALPDGGRWNAFIDALSGYLDGTSLKCMSAEDYAAYSSAATECNWRLPSGYGSLVAALSPGLQVDHGCIVHEVDWAADHVRLSSNRGSVAARAVIVTVSSNVLASGAIRFLPGLDERLHAASQLPLGHVEKMFFSLPDAEEFPNDAHLIGNPRSTDTGSYMLRPLGMPVVEAFFGGEWVSRTSADAMEELARMELQNLLGSQFGKRLKRIATSDWKDDARFGGSYSYARPGQHAARLALSAPVDGPLAFAGEACSPSDFSTVHGAWQTGIDAVAQLLGKA